MADLKHNIQDYNEGWFVRKWNLPFKAPVDENGYIFELEEDENPIGVDAVCEACGEPCEYDSDMCFCDKCRQESITIRHKDLDNSIELREESK